jgi:hypothetical protein
MHQAQRHRQYLCAELRVPYLCPRCSYLFKFWHCVHTSLVCKKFGKKLKNAPFKNCKIGLKII